MEDIIDFFTDILIWLDEKITWVLDGVGLFFKDTFYWVIDMLVSFSYSTVDLVFDTVDWFNPLNYLDMLPPEIINGLTLIGFGEMISIIVSTFIIKLTLQFLPSAGFLKGVF